MPSVRSLGAAAGAAIVVGAVFEFWFHWPTFLSFGLAAVVGLAAVMVATSVGDDEEAADVAWRAQAGDLLIRREGEEPLPENGHEPT